MPKEVPVGLTEDIQWVIGIAVDLVVKHNQNPSKVAEDAAKAILQRFGY